MNAYIATMYRYGDDENHSYVIGVFDDKQMAKTAGDKEELWRGGKYECKIIAIEPNHAYIQETKSEVSVIKDTGKASYFFQVGKLMGKQSKEIEQLKARIKELEAQ